MTPPRSDTPRPPALASSPRAACNSPGASTTTAGVPPCSRPGPSLPTPGCSSSRATCWPSWLPPIRQAPPLRSRPIRQAPPLRSRTRRRRSARRAPRGSRASASARRDPRRSGASASARRDPRGSRANARKESSSARRTLLREMTGATATEVSRGPASGVGRPTRMALYAEVNMNLIDGSSVWVHSVSQTLTRIEGVEVTLLLRAPEQRDVLTAPLRANPHIELVHPEAVSHAQPLDVEAALAVLKRLDVERSFDHVFLRGAGICAEA